MTITTSIPPRIRLQAEDAGHPFHGNQWTGKSAADIADHLEKTFPGMKVDFSEGHGKAELSRIVVPEEQRGSGTGTKAMKHLTDWADANGKTVTLSPSSDFGGNKARLVEFYKRFGFVENKGRNKDFSISDTMFREPSKAVHASASSRQPADKRTARAAAAGQPGRRPAAELRANVLRGTSALEAAAGPLPGQIERVIVSLQNDGRLPIRIPPETMKHVAESLARYFQTASADKIEQFAQAAKEAVEAELKTVNVQTHDTMKADTTGVNVGATPATSRGVLTSFIESATGDNIGGLMNMDFFNRIMREVTQGAGQFVAQNFDQTRLDEFPALELHRVYDREVPRGFKVGAKGAIVPDPDNDWPSRWEAAGGELVDGRMVALKSDPIWQAIGDGEGGYEDTLGNPFAPFAFNSGYDTDEVSRDDAVALGLMDDEDQAEPADFDFTKLLNIEAASGVASGRLELSANWPVESPENGSRRAALGLQASAGDVPLVVKCFITDADGRLLVLQADGYGRMDLPGGHLRAGETVEDGLRREVLEETGMTLNDVKELGTVLVPWNGQQPIVFFSAQSDDDENPVLSDEHVDWFWLNKHEVALRNFSALNKVVNNFTDGKDLNEA